jgi:hypothetical protein
MWKTGEALMISCQTLTSMLELVERPVIEVDYNTKGSGPQTLAYYLVVCKMPTTHTPPGPMQLFNVQTGGFWSLLTGFDKLELDKHIARIGSAEKHPLWRKFRDATSTALPLVVETSSAQLEEKSTHWSNTLSGYVVIAKPDNHTCYAINLSTFQYDWADNLKISSQNECVKLLVHQVTDLTAPDNASLHTEADHLELGAFTEAYGHV